MAEVVIGLTASLIAVTGAAGVGVKYSVYLYDIYRQVKDADRAIATFAADIENFSSVLEFSLQTLDFVCSRLDKSSPLALHLNKKKIFVGLKLQAERVENSINQAWDHTESVQSRFGYVTRINWVVRRKAIMSLKPEMDSLKTSLGLVATSIDLYLTQQNSTSRLSKEQEAERQHKIKSLEAQIKVHVKTIAVLLEVNQLARSREQEGSGDTRRPYKIRSSTQEALIDLGTSIAEHGRVPSPQLSSHSSSTASSRPTRRSKMTSSVSSVASPRTYGGTKASKQPGPRTDTSTDKHRALNTVRDPPERQPSKMSHAETPPSQLIQGILQTPSRQPPRDVETPIVQVIQRIFQTPELRRTQHRIADRSTSGTSSSLSYSGSSGDASDDDYSEPGTLSARRHDHDPVEATSTSRYHYPSGRNVQRVPGRITTPEGLVTVTALLDTAFPQSVISVAYAASLGLVIEPRTKSDGDNLDGETTFYDGKSRKNSGIVLLEWNAVARPSRRPFVLKCSAYEHGDQDLVLGRDFEKERLHNWGVAS